MPEMHLRQPEFTYSACRPFTKSKEATQKLKETEDSGYIHQNELELAFSMTWFKKCLRIYLKRAASDKILHDIAINIAKNPKYDGHQRGLASMV